MRRTPRALAAAIALLVPAVAMVAVRPAGAALATVGNGIATADLASPGTTPTTLAEALVGPGVTVSNATFAGAPAQAGLIHVVDPAVVSFNDGVILSSGDIANVVGPNKSDGITGDMAGPDDADLNALIQNTQTVNPITFDRAVLEFDFVPSASTVYFTYTFGSDEYLEWVNLFNDVFAFYINGQNCATVPDGSPISIDTINDVVNPTLFRDNSYSAPPTNPINIESDGLSVELICSANVNAGQTNHMKLAIADTSDQILDSVVMLKSHSLSTTKPESCNDSSDNDDDGLVDLDDDSCSATITPPPPGSEGIGSSNSAPPFTGNEGQPISLDASVFGWAAAPEAINAVWTVTGINGTTGSCTVDPAGPVPITTAGVIPTATATCPDDGEYVAVVEGWDAEQKSAFDMDVDFFVHNAPPAVTIGTPAAAFAAVAATTGPTTISATVVDPGATDTVTCVVDWGNGTDVAGTITGDVCSATAILPPGDNLVSVTATDNAGASAAAATIVTVGAAETTVGSNANPSVKGQKVTFTAATTAGTTGTMSFYDGPTLLGTKAVKSGAASFSTTKLATGAHDITVSYLAGVGATPSVSSVLVQQVDPASTTVTVTSSVDPSVFGQKVTVKAAVAPIAPGAGVATGTVDLYDGETLVATKALTSGKATFALKPSVGVHDYTASYSGSTDFVGSTSAPFTQSVAPAATTVGVTSPFPTTTLGHAGMITVTVKVVAPGTGVPTGAVEIFDGTTSLGIHPLVSGKAKLPIASLPVGVHLLTATYLGDGSYATSTTTAAFTQTIV